MSGQLQAPAALPRRKGHRYLLTNDLVRELDWTLLRTEELPALPGIASRLLSRQAVVVSLHRLALTSNLSPSNERFSKKGGQPTFEHFKYHATGMPLFVTRKGV